MCSWTRRKRARWRAHRDLVTAAAVSASARARITSPDPPSCLPLQSTGPARRRRGPRRRTRCRCPRATSARSRRCEQGKEAWCAALVLLGGTLAGGRRSSARRAAQRAWRLKEALLPPLFLAPPLNEQPAHATQKNVSRPPRRSRRRARTPTRGRTTSWRARAAARRTTPTPR